MILPTRQNNVFVIWLKGFSLAGCARFFLYLFFAFLPFQIRGILYSANIYGGEFFSSYLTFFLYFGDIFLVVGLLILALAIIFTPYKYGEFKIGDMWLFSLILLLCSMVGISISFSINPLNSFVCFLRFVEFTVVYLIVVNKIVDLRALMKIFIFSMMINAFVGIFQYVYGHSIGLSFLGEPVVANTTKGVAKVVVDGVTILRSYGTFSHPNVFAVYLIFASFMSLYLLSKEKITDRRVLLIVCIVVFLLAFLLTFSRVAFLTLVLAMALYYVVSEAKIAWKYVLPIGASILLFLVVFNFFDVFAARLNLWGDSAFSEREMFIDISRNMFLDNPWGVGAGNFTYLMQDYTGVKLMPWQFQPVHNIFFLIFNEIGVQGGAVFFGFFGYLFYMLINCLKKSSDKTFACILIALWSVIFAGGLFDHYFVSLYQGQALLFLFAGFVGICGKE